MGRANSAASDEAAIARIGSTEQYRDDGLVANWLWPETLVATAAVLNVAADKLSVRVSRQPEITADAAAILPTQSADAGSGECNIKRGLQPVSYGVVESER